MKTLLLLLFAAPAAAQEAVPRGLPGVRNFRDIGGVENGRAEPVRSGVLLRSGALGRAEPAAIEALLAADVKKVVDLRTLEEIKDNGADPPPLGRKPYLVHINMDVEEFNPDFAVLYPKLWNENAHVFAAVLEMLADRANHPLLVHGQQGVDRTGIVMAMVLEVAGIPRATILKDFQANDGTRRPDPRDLERVMAIWDAHPGGLAGWLEEHAGVSSMTLEMVRHNLFSAEPFVPPEEEEKADKQFAKAEALTAKGRYASAHKEYARIAKKYPKTYAGIISERRARPSAYLGFEELVVAGPSANRIDVVIMGEGYTLKNMSAFDKMARSIPKVFERHEIFGEYHSYHNYWQAILASAEDGVDAFGREYDTMLNGHDSGAAQGQVAVDHNLVMRVLDEMPHEDRLAVVFVKKGVLGTGGGGVATIGGGPSNTVIHEWGHAFGGLMDEYSTDVGYRGKVRSGVNVSNQPDPAEVPWRHWIDAGVSDIGVHEGAAGRAKGAWKSNVKGCAMASGRDFCRVCREQTVLRIYSLVDPIDGCEPAAHPLAGEDPFADPVPPLSGAGPHQFELRAMQPASHALSASWWVLPESSVPGPPSPAANAFFHGDRRDRGPLKVIEEDSAATTKPDRKGLHSFELDPSTLAPGRYRVICRLRDDTRMPKEKWPWVLKDENGVLESERGWWVVVEG